MHRKEAISQGLPRYFTGKPCKNGHISERFTSSRSCIECNKECNKEYYEDNKEKILAQQKEWQKSNPEKIAAYTKEYREEHAEQIKQWRKNNPESLRSYEHKRRAKTKEGEPASVIAAWEQSQNKVCNYCNKNCKDSYHIDHYMPLSKGGTHTINNLRIACAKCNMNKHAKDPYDFARSKGKLF